MKILTPSLDITKRIQQCLMIGKVREVEKCSRVEKDSKYLFKGERKLLCYKRTQSSVDFQMSPAWVWPFELTRFSSSCAKEKPEAFK